MTSPSFHQPRGPQQQSPGKACVIGHPVDHARSPIIHGFWLEQLGLAGSYHREDVAPHELAHFIRTLAQRGYRGCNVTIPHKEAAAACVDHITPLAESAGAVNTIWVEDGETWGDNTDVAGFLAHLDASAPQWRDGCRNAVIVGAGGAARAVIAGLMACQVETIGVFNRTPERAHALQQRWPSITVLDASTVMDALPHADLLINATSIGMNGPNDRPLDILTLKRSAIVCDIVYVPLETALLRDAAGLGLVCVDGLGMLLHQAVPGFERWFGRKPVVSEELRQRVISDLNLARR